MKALVLFSALAVAVGGCNKKDTKPEPAPRRATTPGAQGLSGKVLEVKQGGGYTYLRLDRGGREVWAAVSRAEVKPGETVTVAGAMEMKKFRSKALDRTFDSIFFGQVQRAGARAGEMPAGHPSVGGMPAGHPSVGGKKPDLAASHRLVQGTPVKLERPVPRAEGGKTIAEIHELRDTLAGKSVLVSGQVVKVTPDVMGRTWVHLQDGSGAVDRHDFDLTVTTGEAPRVGDTITVRGVVAANKDFGAGYRYAVIVEQAKVVADHKNEKN